MVHQVPAIPPRSEGTPSFVEKRRNRREFLGRLATAKHEFQPDREKPGGPALQPWTSLGPLWLTHRLVASLPLDERDGKLDLLLMLNLTRISTIFT